MPKLTGHVSMGGLRMHLRVRRPSCRMKNQELMKSTCSNPCLVLTYLGKYLHRQLQSVLMLSTYLMLLVALNVKIYILLLLVVIVFS